jgi:nitroreductase
VSPKRLTEPVPAPEQLDAILGTAAAAPDHGQLLPWRFVIVPKAQRAQLADVFAKALLDRDPQANAEQLENAREKAHRGPFLMLAIARLNDIDLPRAEAQGRGAQHPDSGASEISDIERLISLGCAIQNILLSAHAYGFGAGLTSGQAMSSPHLRSLFSLSSIEQAVCWIAIGSTSKNKPPRVRPEMATFITSLA